MFSMLVLAAAASPQPHMISQASAPPPIVAISSLPPSAVRGPGGNFDSSPAIPVHVRITAGGQELLDDSFRVGRSGGASYQESRSEAFDTACTGQRYYGSQERYSLTMNLYLRDDSSTGPAVNVSVRWQRPSKLLTCNGEGSREVQLTQTIPLVSGQAVTVQGDAGLSVTVSR